MFDKPTSCFVFNTKSFVFNTKSVELQYILDSEGKKNET